MIFSLFIRRRETTNNQLLIHRADEENKKLWYNNIFVPCAACTTYDVYCTIWYIAGKSVAFLEGTEREEGGRVGLKKLCFKEYIFYY